MKSTRNIHTLLITAVVLFASGCYTQLQTSQADRPTTSERIAADRVASGQQALIERSDQIANEEDYELGYEDGWADAEGYYFLDFETRNWYAEYGVNLAQDRFIRNYLAHDPFLRNRYISHYYFSSYYGDPFFHYAYYPYRGHRYNKWHLRMGFHTGWYGWHMPHHGHHYFYSYYRYPFYTPYYGYYGYSRPFFGYYYLTGTNSTRAVRNYGPRSTHLTSRGNTVNRTTRSDARINNATRSRTDVRSAARTQQVNRGERGTSVRNRSTGRTNTGTVNRGTSTNRGSSGTVNRGGSSNRGSSGTVNRGSSNNRGSSGTVNRGSSNERGSSGTVNRGSSNESRSSATVNRGSSNNRTSTGTVNRTGNVRSSLGNSSVTIQRPTATRQQQVVQSIRNRVSAEQPTVQHNSSRSVVANRVERIQRRERVINTTRSTVNRIGSQSINTVIQRGSSRSTGNNRSSVRSTTNRGSSGNTAVRSSNRSSSSRATTSSGSRNRSNN